MFNIIFFSFYVDSFKNTFDKHWQSQQQSCIFNYKNYVTGIRIRSYINENDSTVKSELLFLINACYYIIIIM